MQWTEEAIRAELDGTFVKVHPCGRFTSHSVPDQDGVPERKARGPLPRGFQHVYRRRNWTPDQDQQIIDMRAHGWSYKDIGEHVGRTGEAIHSRLRKLQGGRACSSSF